MMGTNPAQNISPPDAGDSDRWVLSYYDTDDPENTKDDPVLERQYALDEDEYDEFIARLDTYLDEEEGMDMIPSGDFMMMFVDRDIQYEILDTMGSDEVVE